MVDEEEYNRIKGNQQSTTSSTTKKTTVLSKEDQSGDFSTQNQYSRTSTGKESTKGEAHKSSSGNNLSSTVTKKVVTKVESEAEGGLYTDSNNNQTIIKKTTKTGATIQEGLGEDEYSKETDKKAYKNRYFQDGYIIDEEVEEITTIENKKTINSYAFIPGQQSSTTKVVSTSQSKQQSSKAQADEEGEEEEGSEEEYEEIIEVVSFNQGGNAGS